MAGFKEEKMKSGNLLAGIPLIILVFTVLFAVVLTGCEPQVDEDLLIGFWYTTPKDAEIGDMTKAAFHFKDNGDLLINNGNPSISNWRSYSYERNEDTLSLTDQRTQAPAQETTFTLNDSGSELRIDKQCFLLKARTYYKFGSGIYEITPETKVAAPTVTPNGGEISTVETAIVTLDTDTFGANIYYTIDDSDPTTSETRTHYILGSNISISSKTDKIITLKAIAVKTGLDDSRIITAIYKFSDDAHTTVETPSTTPNTGNYTTAQTANVTLTTTTSEAELYYTINGDDPVTDGIYYTPGTSISIKSATAGIIKLKAITVKNGLASSLLTAQYVFSTTSTALTVTSAADSGNNTLREALKNIASGGKVTIDKTNVTKIELITELAIDKNVTIEGNGVIITPAEDFPTGSPLIKNGIDSASGGKTVNISRVHFKGGNNSGASTDAGGGAICNYSKGSLALESCIFSLNNSARGGAIFNEDNASAFVRGCTFYNNTATDSGGVIYHNTGTLTIQGNIFFMNDAAVSGPIVFKADPKGTITSQGYNLSDVTIGTGTNESGWEAGTVDTTISSSGSLFAGADEGDFSLFENEDIIIMPSRPIGFPDKDFNGDTREYPGAPGAVKYIVLPPSPPTPPTEE